MQESAERRQVGQGMERGQGFKRTQDAKILRWPHFPFLGLNSSRLQKHNSEGEDSCKMGSA